MSLLPDEQKVLDRLAGELGAQEPRLKSMFGMFTRLTAPDGQPPQENASPSPRRPVPQGIRLPSRRGGRLDYRGRLYLLLVSAALLTMILVIHLTGKG
jgi:hypothetical protein